MKIGKFDIKDVTDFTDNRICGPLNVFSLISVSMVWGHMLDLLSLWWIPITVLMTTIGYGSEINKVRKEKNISL